MFQIPVSTRMCNKKVYQGVTLHGVATPVQSCIDTLLKNVVLVLALR